MFRWSEDFLTKSISMKFMYIHENISSSKAIAITEAIVILIAFNMEHTPFVTNVFCCLDTKLYTKCGDCHSIHFDLF